ncbi:unnamed protein product [Hermetia illucens]|uniref:Uncharacterized protein n=1 Tax=Hermetia illucens TaxID=343691 RepID=A0A7R8YYU6_HERIL|nr:unnamed protein product [Hermetia illucens]
MGRIPCENARHIEAFTADDAAYVMVANYANFEGQQATTFLYKYRHDQKKFVEHQKFGTQEAADVRYFYIENKEKLKDHFVVVANAMRAEGQSQFKDLGSQSVIYKYKNGVFVPLQQLNFHNVTAFLPIHNEIDKFVLLVACKNQDMKFLRYDGQQFDISRVQLTTGAFAKGVTSLRSFKESNETYIVVANERMMVNETNVYLPFYKIKENRTDLKRKMMEQFKKLYAKLTNGTFASRINRVESVVKNFGQSIGVFNNANISAVESEVVINPKSNLTKRFWRKLAAATEDIQKLEEQFAELSGNKSANTTESDCTFESLQLDTLTVTDVLKISTINNKSIDHFALDRIIADKVIVKGKFQILNNTDEADPAMESLDSESLNRTTRQSDFSEIRVKNIIVTGTINGWNLTEFRNSILKKTGNQIITAPFNFTQLDVGDLQINGSINGERPSKVVMVNEGNFVVDQDLIFAEGAEVNHLVVNNRLSHIYVVDGQLQALYKNHSEVQIIRGWKKFENVNLLEPFELKGKIHSAQLDKMNPVVVISEDLNLEGDYEITGSVLITKQISATNFHGVSSQRNVLEILENGLSVKTPAIYQQMNFQAPLKTKNLNATFVNNIDTRDFITNDGNEEVIITGTKVFRNDLRISRGPCDVQNVNRININDLYENRLRKHGNQTITGQFTFKSVHTAGIKSASKILLNGTDINDILTKSTSQTLAEVNIQHLQTRAINITSMTTSKSKVFNHSLDYMIKDTVLPGTSAEILGHKRFKGNFTINNLFVKKRINHQSVKKLKESLKEILSEGDISIDGDVIIEDDLQIEQIVFDGKINGIPAENFGSCWLLNEGDQEFTAPQEFSHLIAENMHVAKRINDHRIANIIKQLYWLDQEEFLPNVTFAKVIAEDEFITKGRINGLKFAEDVLLKETSETQIIEAPVFCEGDLIVTGEIRDLKVLNNIDLVKLQAVLKGETKNAKLTIDSANFETYPKFRLLNGYDLKEVYKNVWLANEDTVIEGHMIFNDVELKAHAVLNGPMNGVDLDFLQQHYFSLTKAQRVSTPMTFKGPVEFMESLSSEEMNLTGVLVDNISIIKRKIKGSLKTGLIKEISNEANFSSLKPQIEALHSKRNGEQAKTLGITLNRKESLPRILLNPSTTSGETLSLKLKGTTTDRLGHAFISSLQYGQEHNSKTTLLDLKTDSDITLENIETALGHTSRTPGYAHPQQLLLTKITLEKPETGTPTDVALNYLKSRNRELKKKNLPTNDINAPTSRIDDDIEIIDAINCYPNPIETGKAAQTLSNKRISKIIDGARDHLAINNIASHNNKLYAFQNLKYTPGNPLGEFLSNIKRTINISDFALNTLREDIYQEITGEWKIFNAIVEGDLNNVRINGLNLVDDVLRYDVTTTQKITAPKNFTNLIIADLECAEHATINKIDILDWLRNSAFIYGNYTIQGTTTIDDITVYEDVTVFGTVNGVKFDEKHLLLVDTNQTIHGNVVMGAEFEKTHQIKPLSIEHMDVETINGVNVKDFFRDLVPFKNELKIKGGLTFENTPIVRKFHSDRGLLNLENSTDGALNSVKRLIEDHKHLVESFKEKKAFLSHHKFKPKMSGKVHKVLHLKVQTGLGRTEERIAALRGDKEAYITFHRWDEQEGFFDLENGE